ncbi:MAG: hypothetical protein ABW185_26860 [Sedimenticola sp.]
MSAYNEPIFPTLTSAHVPSLSHTKVKDTHTITPSLRDALPGNPHTQLPDCDSDPESPSLLGNSDHRTGMLADTSIARTPTTSSAPAQTNTVSPDLATDSHSVPQ